MYKVTRLGRKLPFVVMSLAAAAFATAAVAATDDVREAIAGELVEPNVLIAADPGSSPPSCSMGDTGEAEGYFVDLTKQFADRMGLEYRFVPIDWPGVLAGLTAQRFDMGGCQVVHTVERENSDSFIPSTYFSGQGVRLIVPESSEIADWADISGKTIGAQKGSSELEAVKKEVSSVSYTEYGGFSEIILDLASGRIDGALGPEIVLSGLIKERPDAKLKIVATPIAFTSRGTMFPANHKAMAKEFDAFVDELRASGELDALVTKWFGAPIFDWARIGEAYERVKADAAATAQ
jgi:ABC-type amino acid transport substrate-binding protein